MPTGTPRGCGRQRGRGMLEGWGPAWKRNLESRGTIPNTELLSVLQGTEQNSQGWDAKAPEISGREIKKKSSTANIAQQRRENAAQWEMVASSGRKSKLL